VARFEVSLDVPVPPEQVWARLTDWPSHSRWIPLTTVRVTTPRPTGVGAIFVGRTGVGPVGFDDPMEIVEWLPPVAGRSGHCRVVKLGRVVLGWAEFDVTSRGGAGGHGSADSVGSTVRWVEEIQIAPARLTRIADPLIGLVGRIGTTRALRLMAAELTEGVRAGD
jgi:uncharacterized protein YndB with AHSA1/START domain